MPRSRNRIRRESLRERANAAFDCGAALREQGQPREARVELERALRLERQLHGDDNNLDVGATLYLLGWTLEDLGELEEAREHLERALAIGLEGHDGELHAPIASTLHTLGSVVDKLGDQTLARQHLERSLRIQLELTGDEEDQGIASTLHVLARVLMAQGELSAAHEHLERSLCIQLTAEPPDPRGLVVTQRLLAELLEALGLAEEERSYLDEALDLWRRLSDDGEEDAEISRALHALGGLLMEQGELEEARQHLERSLAMDSALYGGEEHPNTICTLHSLALLSIEEGNIDEGLRLMGRVIELSRRVLGEDDEQTTVNQISRAFALYDHGPRDEGLALLVEHRKRLEASDPEHPYLAMADEILAEEAGENERRDREPN